ncbi:MAG: GntR family transcriptional regulator [Caulobacteraceae bacterium]
MTLSTPSTLYSRIREHLRAQILDGVLEPHSQLPSESELGAMFKVSRITVRQALSDLQRENLIFKVAGKGAFVSKPKTFQPLTQLEGFAAAMERLGHEVRNRVLSQQVVQASPTIAARLALAPGDDVAEIQRVRLVDREPISYEVTYLPAAEGQRLFHEDLAGRDIFAILENEFSIPLGHADLQIDAVAADEQLARILTVPEGGALLRIERLTHRASGEALDFERLYFRGDAFQYRLRLSRQEGAHQ